MAYIVPKLNLNRLPKNCEDYSLTCAKNIKVVDDTIVNFDGLKQAVPRTLNIVLSTTGPNVTDEQYEEDEAVVNQHRRIRRENYDVAQGELIITAITEAVSCIASVDNFYILYKIVGLNYTILDESGEEPVIRPSDITPDIKEDFEDTFLNSIIILDYNKYIELNATTLGTVVYPTVYKHKRLNVIEGSVVLNSKGNTILELHQYGVDTTVPISFINLEEHNPTDIFLVNKDTGQPWWWYMDASYYTQTPIIPILNFVFKEYTKISVNSGVYSLFIRYKVFGDTYSNWISCSTPFFIGNHRKTDTQVGSFYYSDSVLLASDYTITFDIVSAFNPSNQPIEAELAYLCKTEDEEYAAKLTTLKIEQLSQSFTFVPSHATDERISINDLLEPIFNITNVKNVTYKNNEFFASNYIEESLNKELNIITPTLQVKKEVLQKFYDNEEQNNNNNLTDEIEINLLSNYKNNQLIGETTDYEIVFQKTEQNNITAEPLVWLDQNFEDTKKAVLDSLYQKAPSLRNLENIEDTNKNPINYILDNLTLHSVDAKWRSPYKNNKFLSYLINQITSYISNINNNNHYTEGERREECGGEPYDVIYFDATVIEDNVRRPLHICDIIEKIKIVDGKIKIKRVNSEQYDTREYEYLSFCFYTVHTDWGGFPKAVSVKVIPYTQSIIINKKEQKPIPKFIDDSPILDNITTLIPKQTYRFYVHFVKNNGFVTNGIEIGDITTPEEEVAYNTFYAYLPEFCNADYSKLDSSYVAYFYSFRKLDNYVAEGIKCKDSNITIENKDVYDVPEMDLWLYSRYGEDGNKYKPSNTLEHYKYFGNSGKYEIEENENNKDIIYLSSKKEYDKTLYRCTPYIPIEIKDFTLDNILVSDYKHSIFVNGYPCKIYKAKNYTTSLEEDDRAIWIDAEYYKKEFNNADKSVIGLNSSENSDTLSDTFVSKSKFRVDGAEKDETSITSVTGTIQNVEPEEITSVNFGQIRYSYPIYIHSNYNINFLRLREDFVYSPKNIKIKLRNGVKKNADNVYEITYETVYKGIYIYKIASNTLDNIYKTIPFYKEFNILTYAEYDYRDTNEEYNTTIRKTAPIVASNKWELPKFKSTLLYNLDTNRGLITNLVAVGKAILIHTEKGLSAFEYNPKLTTNNGEINVENTEIFDINPVDVIGSENGYGGLKDKSNSAVCFEGYMFVDITSNEILLYDDSGLKPLTKDLKYLLSYFDIVDAKLAGVQRNNICLLCLTVKNKIDNKEYIITISYNFELERFVSIHDFKFTKAVFNSINTIFEHKIEQTSHGILLRAYDYSIIDFSDIFSVIPEFAQYNREDEDYLYPIKSEEEDDIVKHNSYIDVIVVGNYEQIKVLDFINWSLIVPNDFIGTVDDDSIDNTAETSYDNDLYNQDSSLLPYQTPFKRDNAKSITIISDSARTNEIDLTDATNDKELINTNTDKVNKDSYQKPRFNCGIWSLNYFRNEYAKDVNEKTLIYGKYFIIRFVFKTKRFKFETLNINTNKYV